MRDNTETGTRDTQNEQIETVAGVVPPSSAEFQSRQEFIAFLEDDEKDGELGGSRMAHGMLLIAGFSAAVVCGILGMLGFGGSVIGSVALVILMVCWAGLCFIWSIIYTHVIRNGIVRYDEFGGQLLKYDAGLGIIIGSVVFSPVGFLPGWIGFIGWLLGILITMSLTISRNGDLHRPDDG